MGEKAKGFRITLGEKPDGPHDGAWLWHPMFDGYPHAPSDTYSIMRQNIPPEALPFLHDEVGPGTYTVTLELEADL